MKKLFLLGLSLALVGGVACSAEDTTQPRALDAAQGCATGHQTLETLDLTVLWPSGPVARGSVAEIDVKVVRSVDVDVTLQKDLPKANSNVSDPTSAPVEGAFVALSLSMPNIVPLSGTTVTNEKGLATVAIKVKRSTPTGAADGTAFAWREVFDGPCVSIVETGENHKEAAATIE